MVTKKKTQKRKKRENGFWDDADIISIYTRAQAIEDGVLVDVSEMAKEAGIKFPVAITRAVWNDYITPDPRSKSWGQSIQGRLWDVLWMFRNYARAAGGKDRILFQVLFIMKEKQQRKITLKAIVSGGDRGEPVITIMLPNED
jgi:hypothetical protein